MNRVVWNVTAGLAAILAGWAARRAAMMVWSKTTGNEAPTNPADTSVEWGEALGWALIAGLIAALGRVFARRGAATAWEKVTGESPPGVRTA